MQRCDYCDFFSSSGLDHLIPSYIKALKGEIEWLDRVCVQRLPVHTIYFGGGTPSLVPPPLIADLMNHLNDHFDLTADVEITMEANPGTLNLSSLRDMRSCGVNRLSLGVQAVQERLLSLLGRVHTMSQVIQAVDTARQVGFDNLSLDLIYGIPTQTEAEWRESLTKALGFSPEHLSLYALTLEDNVPLQQKIHAGELLDVDDDLAADMYEWSEDTLEKAGYEHYEISNWAWMESGEVYRCRHNIQYWENGDYLGIGAGAHGSVAGLRITNTNSIVDYIECISRTSNGFFPLAPAVIEKQMVTSEERMGETMLLGLRLTESGVSERGFLDRFGISYFEVYRDQIIDLISKGLLEKVEKDTGRSIRLTKKGHLLGNQVFMRFVT